MEGAEFVAAFIPRLMNACPGICGALFCLTYGESGNYHHNVKNDCFFPILGGASDGTDAALALQNKE